MTAPATPLYVDIYSVKLIAPQHGSHFFDPEAMRFFRSRTSREAIYHDGKYYFVTSEQFETWSQLVIGLAVVHQPALVGVIDFQPRVPAFAPLGGPAACAVVLIPIGLRNAGGDWVQALVMALALPLPPVLAGVGLIGPALSAPKPPQDEFGDLRRMQ